MTEQKRKFFVKNRKDFDELPEHFRDGLTIQFVGAYPDVASVELGS